MAEQRNNPQNTNISNRQPITNTNNYNNQVQKPINTNPNPEQGGSSGNNTNNQIQYNQTYTPAFINNQKPGLNNNPNIYNQNPNNQNPQRLNDPSKLPVNVPNQPGKKTNQNTGINNNYFQVPGKINQEPETKKPFWKDFKLKPFLKKWWWAVTAGALVLAIGIVSLALFASTRPEEEDNSPYDNITATITVDPVVSSGTPTDFRIRIENKESTALENITIKLNLDDTFTFIDSSKEPSQPDGSEYELDRLSAFGQQGDSANIDFSGTLVGSIDEVALFDGEIIYIPNKIRDQENNSRTVDIEPVNVRIASPDINLNISSKEDKVQNGGEAQLNITFENISDEEIQDIRLRMKYPSGGSFSYRSSELVIDNGVPIKTPDDGNNEWDIRTLSRNQRQNLVVIGDVFGPDGSDLLFEVFIESKQTDNTYVVLTQTSTPIRVVSQPLDVEITLEGKEASKIFTAGETIGVIINYQNRGEQTLRNIEIIATLEDQANLLDYNTIKFTSGERGTINNRSIVWKGINVPLLANLSPQASGVLKFTIQTKDEGLFTASGLNQTSYFISPKVQASGANLQNVNFTGNTYRAKGDLAFEQTITEVESDTLNSNQALYKIEWVLKTKQNQVNNVKVKTRSSLLESAWARLNVSPESEASKLKYNAETGELSWEPGNLKGYLGLNDVAVMRISFEVFLEVEPGQPLTQIELFEEVVATGADDYTGERYEVTQPAGESS